ncbi:MIP/aquaporin family protein [soil metagenome]
MGTTSSRSRRAAAEVVGTCFLLLAIVGSGIAADRLTDDAALTLLINALVTGAALAAVITAVGPISGAHLNPAVTLAVAMQRGLAWRDVPIYVAAQLAGALIGVVGANLMFDLPAIDVAQTQRTGLALWLSELVATFGLLTVIWGTVRLHAGATVAAAVGAYVAAAIWFTSSTAFANPAVTVGRVLTDTYTGIAPMDALPFVAAQLAGAVVATILFRWLLPALPALADDAVIPRDVRR